MALTTPASIGGGAAAGMTRSLTKRKFDVKSKVVEFLLLGSLAITLLVLLALIVDLIQRSWPVWTDRPYGFLTGGLNSQSAEAGGIGQAIKGTIMLSIIVVIVAFPLGVACATYLEEYAGRSRFAQLTRVNVRNLAGVPSIVYGLLGLAIFVKAIRDFTGGTHRDRRRIGTVGARPADRRDHHVRGTAGSPAQHSGGALGVGATEWETVRHHVLPAAAPGILTGTMLTLRAPPVRRPRSCWSAPLRACCAPATRASSSNSAAPSRRSPWRSSPMPDSPATTSGPSPQQPRWCSWCWSCS